MAGFLIYGFVSAFLTPQAARVIEMIDAVIRFITIFI
jgi:hypothetical protein